MCLGLGLRLARVDFILVRMQLNEEYHLVEKVVRVSTDIFAGFRLAVQAQFYENRLSSGIQE